LRLASREVWSVFLWVCHETIGLHSIRDRSREGFGPVRRPSLDVSRAASARAAGHAGLHCGHPLVRAAEAVGYTGRQCVYVAAVLIGSVIALIEGRPWAAALAGSAAAVLLVLGVLLAAHLQAERDCAIELVLDGRESLRIAAVERQRHRLLSERTRYALASRFEDVLEQASAGRRFRLIAPPLFEPRIVRAVANELGDVIESLRSEGTSAGGVARAERLVERAVSPLYGQDAEALREELHRVHKLLRG
jgi:hypothetical protein